MLKRVEVDQSDVGDIIVERAIRESVADIEALACHDPAAQGDPLYVCTTYASIEAIIAYRICHEVHQKATCSGWPEALITARRLTEAAKGKTGIDIHPAARIGKRFMLDHGYGTVIGDTVELGDDCYLLQGVILGASGIAHNNIGKRHPTVGHGCEIGAFARILGPVTVGANCVISPHAVVLTDIPSDSRVGVFNQCQLTIGSEVTVFGIVPERSGKFSIYGRGLAPLTPELVVPLRSTSELMAGPALRVESREDERLSCSLQGSLTHKEYLRLTDHQGNQTILTQLAVVWKNVQPSPQRPKEQYA